MAMLGCMSIRGATDDTAEARTQLSHNRMVAWALCLQSDSGTHFTILMHYVHAQQTLMYTAMEFSGAKALERERVKAILVSQHGGFYRPKSPLSLQWAVPTSIRTTPPLVP